MVVSVFSHHSPIVITFPKLDCLSYLVANEKNYEAKFELFDFEASYFCLLLLFRLIAKFEKKGSRR